MARPRAAQKKEAPEVTAESIVEELTKLDGDLEDPEEGQFYSTWAHRVQSEAFVRAFAWARKKGNELKASLIYADSKENDFEESDTPVVNRD